MLDINSAEAWATIVAGVVAAGSVFAGLWKILKNRASQAKRPPIVQGGTLHNRQRTVNVATLRELNGQVLDAGYSSGGLEVASRLQVSEWTTYLRRRLVCPAPVEVGPSGRAGSIKRVRAEEAGEVILEVTVGPAVQLMPASSVRPIDRISANARLLALYREQVATQK